MEDEFPGAFESPDANVIFSLLKSYDKGYIKLGKNTFLPFYVSLLPEHFCSVLVHSSFGRVRVSQHQFTKQ